MTGASWDELGESYAEHIFSVLRNDKGGQLAAAIAKHVGRGQSAADLGCGPGQVTPLLAERFATVHACDASAPLLQQARRACAAFPNVQYHHYDLAAAEPPAFPPVDLALCVNVLLTPDLETREQLWHRITSLVGANGVLLLVVPSHESALYTNFRRLDWHVRAGCSAAEALRQGLAQHGDVPQLEQGIREIDGVLTKHYLREEIIVQLADRSLEVEQLLPLPYDWSTEFADPPAWLGEPFPWNWLAIARRRPDA